MADRVRVGFIGTSRWAELIHLPSLKSHPRAELAAICGRNAERAREVATKYEIPAVFADYRKMIEQARLDALVIAAPDDQHYAMVMDALDAGLHVLCEKPLALSTGHAREMHQKAEATGVKHMVLFTWRWLPIYQYLRELVRDGYVGRCYHLEIRYLAGYARSGEYRWRFDAKRANGVLGDLGVHMIDLARLLAGEIVGVSARLGTFVPMHSPDGIELETANESAVLTLEFASGTHATIHVTAVALTPYRTEQYISLHGENGRLETEWLVMPGKMELQGMGVGESQLQTLEVPDHFWGAADRNDLTDLYMKQPVADRLFIDAIVNDRPISPNFYDGVKAQEVIDAALESHRRGVWVALT